MRSFLSLMLMLVGLGSSEAGAQSIQLIGGDVQIVVPFAGAGFGTGVNTATRLRWSGATLGAQQKITAQTFVNGQRYGLTVQAVPDRFGRSAGRIVLAAGAPPRNLIVDIPASLSYLFGGRGEAPLRYEATATAASPAGQDRHIVVYTITQQ